MDNTHSSKNFRNDFAIEPSGSKTESNQIKAPGISLPKGGGAIKNIDEKFSVNAANGMGSFALPFPFSPSRNSFIPSITLGYSSGAGNGIFGLGWSAMPPSIVRKTDRKLPQYRDDVDADVFIFSGLEDLVPSYSKNALGEWKKDEELVGGIRIIRYKPRTEGSFSRIERIVEPDNNYFWRVTSRNNTVSVYGKSKSAQLCDPSLDLKIFAWYLEFSYDDKGNCFQFEYQKEDKVNVPDSLHEKNRLNGLTHFTNTYLKRIKYCNKDHFDRSSIDYNDWENFLAQRTYLLELVLDFGDHDFLNPQPVADKLWSCRSDSFSDYRAGFDIRTNRLCRRVLMFHHFTELGVKPCLVRSLDFEYDTSTAFTLLKSVTQKGFIRKPDLTYSEKSLPPIEFSYEPLGWNLEVKSLPAESLENLSIGIDGQGYQWMDFYGEGISGILTEQQNAWYYKSNLGEGMLDALKLISVKPSFSGIASGEVQFQDIEANGQMSLVSRALNGFFELSPENEWLPFKTFEENPTVSIHNKNVKFIDLNGDGRADILISEDDIFTWYESKGKEGYAIAQTSPKSRDEESGPNVVFSDQTESIALADMSGDGLLDIVRIRNNDIAYWPNLGYGRFGAKISMSNAPVFDEPDQFNSRFLKLADLDGSGTTDIVYLGNDSFKIYFNQSGNTWSEQNIMNGTNPIPFPKIDAQMNCSIIDLLGSGTGCIVWSSPLPENATRPLRYIDLMNGKKPYLMTSYKNNMGKEVLIDYRPSTFFYLEDKKAGNHWVTKLPFPVHCVSRMVVVDHVTKTRFSNQYSYHHGYYDYKEREFRGFGRVDQTDTENFENYRKNTDPNGNIQIVDENFYQPPTLTKTWFHTGAFLDQKKILDQFAHEYFENTVLPEKILEEPALVAEWTVEEWQEALRACKGMPLRVEVYSQDGSDREGLPFTTTRHTVDIQMNQPKLQNEHAVFMVQEREGLVYNYERDPADPRIAHSMNIEIDEYGNVLKSASIQYGRKGIDNSLTVAEQAEQQKTHVIIKENFFTNKIDDGNYCLPVLYEARTSELTGTIPAVGSYYALEEIEQYFYDAVVIPYQALPSPGVAEMRMIENVKTLFFKNDLTGPLQPGEVESLLLPYQSYQLALTPVLVDFIFQGRVTDQLLTQEGKFVKLNDGNYWIASGTQEYDPNNFYQVTKVTDVFGYRTSITYDNTYRLFVQQITDELQNTSKVRGFNFRALTPYLMSDMNDNRSGVRLDELGMIKSSFVMGKANEQKGDFLDENAVEGSIQDEPTTMLEYDLFNFLANGKPNFTKTTAREMHHFESLQTGIPVHWQTSYSYTDGGGNEIMRKTPAEPGIALQENGDGTVTEVNTGTTIRWVGNGRTILNNKGKPVKQYEPFFSTTFKYEDSKELVERGVTPIIFYDSIGRMIKTALANGTFIEVEFDSWMHKSYDQNDTVLESQWYRDRIISPVVGIATPEEIDAATKAAAHANTPTLMYLDSLGRNFISFVDNGTEGKFKTRTELDVEGNIRSIVDARNNTLMQYKYDMLGNQLYQRSLDAGERWILGNAMGKLVRRWDNRNHEFSFAYDRLHRPLTKRVTGGDGPQSLNHMFEKIIYGENFPDDTLYNLRGKAIITYDTSGKSQTLGFDFKGNALSTEIRVTSDYKQVVQWDVSLPDSALAQEIFASSIEYDALNRVRQQISPDNTIYQPLYNEASLLEKVLITHLGLTKEFVRNIDYNERGQRSKIIYGNDVATTYTYEKNTFRLVHLQTRRLNGDSLQDLYYTFDPVGNITRIIDENVPEIFFNNQQVRGISGYTYDALYQLKEATGREHVGQLTFGEEDNWNDLPFLKKYSPNSAMQWRNYTQQYQYDTVGNIVQMKHIAGTGSWTRYYTPDTDSNRLLSTQVGNDIYSYTHHAQHGFITSMPHLQVMQWNFKEELQAVAKQRVTNGTAETTYYIYDRSGQRTRKITERKADTGLTPTKKSERIYVGGIEIYREYNGTNDKTLERQTYPVSDDIGRIAMIETRTAGQDDGRQILIRYQFGNHQGSASIETDENANVISYEEYHPFGTTSYQAMDAGVKAAYKRYRYTGMERDDESGLEYHGARYYLPWLGRWLNTDPLKLNQGINFYIYSHNSPINFIDENGKEPTDMGPANMGTMHHYYTLARIMLNLRSGGLDAEFEMSTRIGGSRSGKDVGSVDIVVNVDEVVNNKVTSVAHLYDLKPAAQSVSAFYKKMIKKYSEFYPTTSKPGTVLEDHEDLLKPIFYGSLEEPGRIWFYTFRLPRNNGKIVPGIIEYTVKSLDAGRLTERDQKRLVEEAGFEWEPAKYEILQPAYDMDQLIQLKPISEVGNVLHPDAVPLIERAEAGRRADMEAEIARINRPYLEMQKQNIMIQQMITNMEMVTGAFMFNQLGGVGEGSRPARVGSTVRTVAPFMIPVLAY